MKYEITLVLFFFLIYSRVSGQDGILVPFLSDALITVIGPYEDAVQSTVIQADGKIVAAGFSDNGSNYDFIVVRYNSDGSLDNTFSEDGIAVTSIGTGDGSGQSVAIQDDGKIVVAGCSYNGSNTVFTVVRYNSDGSLDDTFSGDGIALTTVGTRTNLAQSVAIQADGKIVVSGASSDNINIDITVIRYNSDGSLDDTFSDDGIVVTPVGTGDDCGNSVAIQADGKIVVAGYSNNMSNCYITTLRYNNDGTLDGTFSGDGIALTAVGTVSNYGNSVAIQPDGKIVVAGYSANSINTDFTVVRYNSDGSLDGSFSGDGAAVTDIGTDQNIGKSLAIQADGKIVVAGYSFGTGNSYITVARYNNDGTPDASFSDDGITVTAGSMLSISGNSVAIQPGGMIVVAGYCVNIDNNDIAIVRFSGSSGPLPVELTSFTANTKNNYVELAWTTATELNNYGFEIQRSTALKIFGENSKGNQENAQWEMIGFVQGNGNANSPKKYSFIDADPVIGDLQYRLKQIDVDGGFNYYSNIAELNFNLTDIKESHLKVPTEYVLSQNYPNPFNPETVISYQLPVSCYVEIKIFDILGKEVAILVNDEKQPGYYQVDLNADKYNLSSGVFFYQLRTEKFISIKKLVLIK